jgi:hypothetical protein
MELSIINRLRIGAVLAIGIVVMGFLAWPLVVADDPLTGVTLYGGQIEILSMLLCVALAVVIGAASYFVSYPYGYEMGPLAVPAGLATWACRGGDMTSLIRMHNTLEGRTALYAALRWEGFFWLLLIAAGFAGVYLAMKLSKGKPGSEYSISEKTSSSTNKTLNILSALIAAVVVALICISLLARDVNMFDSQLGSVTGQPSTGQVAFAVMVAFGAAAFLIKKILDVDYRYPAVASVLLLVFVMTAYTKQDVMRYMIENWPAAFYTRAVCAMLPIQVVSFAFLGSIAGFWLAIKFDYWHKHAE